MVDVSSLTKINWFGKWIWADYVTPRSLKTAGNVPEQHPITSDEMNVFVLFRHTFSVKSDLNTILSAQLCITVDSRYKLFVNGKYVGRGINRCESYAWYYNTYEIKSFLQPGINVIAIHARFFGRELSGYTPPAFVGSEKSNSGKGGVLFDLQLIFQQGTQERIEMIGSGSDTKCIRNIAELHNAPTKQGLGWVEVFNSPLQPKEWNEANFNDTAWKSATIYDYPIKTLVIDPNQQLFEEEILASEILRIGEFQDVERDMDESERKEVDFNILTNFESSIEPLNSYRIINQEYLLQTSQNKKFCEITNTDPNKGALILLQFPREMVGYPRFLVDGPAGTVIDIITSEKVVENQLDMDFITSKRGSRVILRGGLQFFEQWDYDGFIVIQIKIRNLNGTLKIHKICTNRTNMQTSQQGRFECNDKQITELWNNCAYTLLCCATDGYMDCPWREQRSYIGDAYVEALIANVCFGEPRLTKKMIYDVAFGQRIDGLSFCIHPGDNRDNCFVISDYCFYWIQIAWDYYWQYGDEQALLDLYPHFLLSLQWFWKYLDPQIHLLGENLPYSPFIDWAYDGKKPGFNGIFNAQFADCCEIVAKIAEKIGDISTSKKLLEQANQMRIILDQLLWDPTQGAYRDYTDGKKPCGLMSQHTNAYLALKKVAPQTRWPQIITRIFDGLSMESENQQININRPKSPDYKKNPVNSDSFILVAQPFFMHYVHRFLAHMKRYDIIIRYMKKGWIPMVLQGKTHTIWEFWSPRFSECHAWAATPAYDLSTYWLGVRSNEPGFEKATIQPTFEAFEWVKGIYPTNKGDIHLEWHKKDESGKVRIEMKLVIPPKILKTILTLPQIFNKSPHQIVCNGQEIVTDSLLKSLPPGNYNLSFEY